MINKIKFFLAWFGAFVNRKKIAKAHAIKKAEAKKVLDEKFLKDTKTLAQEMIEMHKAVKVSNPTDYIRRMQPYFIMLKKIMNENNCDPIAAAMYAVTKKTKRSSIIWIYATAAEMLLNTPANGTKGS